MYSALLKLTSTVEPLFSFLLHTWLPAGTRVISYCVLICAFLHEYIQEIQDYWEENDLKAVMTARDCQTMDPFHKLAACYKNSPPSVIKYFQVYVHVYCNRNLFTNKYSLILIQRCISNFVLNFMWKMRRRLVWLQPSICLKLTVKMRKRKLGCLSSDL